MDQERKLFDDLERSLVTTNANHVLFHLKGLHARTVDWHEKNEQDPKMEYRIKDEYTYVELNANAEALRQLAKLFMALAESQTVKEVLLPTFSDCHEMGQPHWLLRRIGD